MGNKFGLDKLKQEFEKTKQNLPKKIADESRSFFIKSFSNQGFTDNNLEKWPARSKNSKKSTKEILTKTGRLKRSIRISVGYQKAVLSTDVPYAKIHNEGGEIYKKASTKVLHFKKVDEYRKMGKNGKMTSFMGAKFSKKRGAHYAQKVKIGEHTIHMPKRHFMGRSRTLDKRINLLIKKEIERTFKMSRK